MDMKQTLMALVCLFLFSLPCLPQLPVRINERPVVLNTATGTLKGKMVIPNLERGYPVVLIIAGSGPTDMDGNSAVMPGKNNSLKYLAEGLAGKGIASLRYDKRGIASSASAGKDEYSMRFEDGIQDARGWIDYLSRDKRISGIYVLGHSEGALVGMAASVDNPKVKGYISLAGAGHPAYEIVEEQMSGQPEVIRDMVKSINASLRAGKLVADVPMGLQALFRSSVQPYMISWYAYDPREIIKQLDIPVLILQGDKDIQVAVKDAELLKQARPSADYHLIGNMNHLLKVCDTIDREKQMATYTDPALPVHKDVFIFVEKFVTKP